MGVEFKAIVLAEDPELAEAALAAGWEKVDQLDRLLSDYRSDSGAMLLARSAPHTEPVEVAPELWRILKLSREISERTGGGFDVTVGPASHLWRNAIKRNRLPPDDEIEAALERIGWEKIQLLADHRVKLDGADMILDFGGIAQGYAADAMIELLQEAGIHSALVDASGDIAVTGSADEAGRPWRVSLPGNANPVELKEGGLATSGSATQFLIADGVLYSHLIDPRTARSSAPKGSVTVKADSATVADALATAFSVLSEEESRRIAEDWPGVNVWFEASPEPGDGLENRRENPGRQGDRGAN